MVKNSIPKHIGYIVDGNRRWAKARGLKSSDGHKAGFEALKSIVKATHGRGVEYVSAYIFSTENWNRTKEEVGYLMNLFELYFGREIKDLHRDNIKIVFSGNRTQKVSKKLVKLMEEAESLTENNTAGTLCLCFNYGGQLEITEAVQKIAKKIEAGEMKVSDIDENIIYNHLYHPEVPAIDLMVRTSGERRISNFQLWRMAYSEMLFLDKAWPDMTEDDVDYILDQYKNRDRRMGGDSKK